jgi:hypothetical protein
MGTLLSSPISAAIPWNQSSSLYEPPRAARLGGGGRSFVVTAYILVQTEVGKAGQVAKEIVEIPGVQQAEPVTGPTT